MDNDYENEISGRNEGREGDRETWRSLYEGNHMVTKKEAPGMMHQGVIVTLKDSYGFIESQDFKDHVFFHFAEVKRQDGVPLLGTTNGQSILAVGDEVSFYSFINEKKNKEEAISVTILPKGTIMKELLMKRDIRGRIELVAKNKRVAKLLNETGSTAGIIRILYTDGTEETVSYESDDVDDMRITLHIGDEIVCNVIQGYRASKKRAANVKLVKANPERRHRGVLRGLSDTGGMIYIADLGKNITFSAKDVKLDIQELHIGQEIECRLINEKDELIAAEINILTMPVKKEVQENRYRGIIQKECWPAYLVSMYELDTNAGLIKSFTGQDKGIEFPFIASDITAAYATLHRGDEVDFKVVHDSISGKRKAVAISLAKSVTETRERGKIVALDQTGGRLMGENGCNLPFHILEFFIRDERRTLDINDVVEYVPFKQNGIPVAAVRISHVICMPIDDVEIIARECRGLVLQECTTTNQGSPGKIQVKRGNETEIATFHSEDLLKTSKVPKAGDKAEFDLAVSKPHGDYRAIRVMRIDVSSLVDGEYEIVVPHERGILHNLKEGFGFIRTPAREGNLFFHFSEYKGTELELKTGMLLEYTLVMDKKLRKYCAIRVQRISEQESIGSDFNIGNIEGKPTLNDTRYRGTITAEFINKHRSKLYNEEVRWGEIEYTDQETLHHIHFDADDIEKGWCGLHVSDQVEFSIRHNELSLTAESRSRHNGAFNIVLINPTREQRRRGIIASVRDGFGFVKSSPYDHEVFFHFSEFQESNNEGILHFGDEVEYNQIERGGKPYAVRLERLIPGTLGRKEIGWIESIRDNIVNIMARSGQSYSYNPSEIEIKETLVQGDEIDFFVQPSTESTETMIWKVRKFHVSPTFSPTSSKRSQNTDFMSLSQRKDKTITKSIVTDVLDNVDRPSTTRFTLTRSSQPEDPPSRFPVSENHKPFGILRTPKGPDGTLGFKCTRNI
jgi:cold shock CspA family protein